MSAEKRNFTDFKNFPGKLNEGTGIYEFPLLKHNDDKDRLRMWQIFVRLVKYWKKQTGIDWDLLNEKQIPIKEKYFEIEENYTDLPENVVAEAWVETGIEGGKITRNAPSYFDKVAFEGNSNQRNPFQQALIYARGQYLKRMEKGGTLNASGNKKIKGNVGAIMYFPMLAKTWKDGKKHLNYPLYIQPKLDGVRCLMFLKKHNGGAKNVVIYSRTQKEFKSMDYIKDIVYPYLNDLYDTEKNQSIYLDGELYKHGKKLQDISGESRNEKKRPTKNSKTNPVKRGTKNNVKTDDTVDDTIEDKTDVETEDKTAVETKEQDNTDDNTEQNEYHIYDCFYPLELDTEYESRKEQLDVLFNGMTSTNDTNALRYIKPVETILVKTEQDAIQQYETFIANGYEGAILRNTDGIYLANASKTGAFMRSRDLVKMKKKFTSEYEVISFTEGRKGKDKGAVIWVARTEDGKKFNVTPKDMTYEQRYKVFKDCKKNFNRLYKGRMLTVEYEDLSKTQVPQRAKALVFRDYE